MIGDITSWCGIEGPEKTESSTGKTDKFKYLKERISALCESIGLTDDDIIAVKFDRGTISTKYYNNSVYGDASLPIQSEFINGNLYSGMILDPISGFTLTALEYGNNKRITVGTENLQDTPIFLILGKDNYGNYYGSSRQSIESYPATYLSKKEFFEELDSYND